MIEVRGLVAAAKSIIAVQPGMNGDPEIVLREATALGIWDPAVSALRSCVRLADVLTAEPKWRDRLEWLYDASNDRSLARRAGFRTRSKRSPEELLTPREMESST